MGGERFKPMRQCPKSSSAQLQGVELRKSLLPHSEIRLNYPGGGQPQFRNNMRRVLIRKCRPEDRNTAGGPETGSRTMFQIINADFFLKVYFYAVTIRKSMKDFITAMIAIEPKAKKHAPIWIPDLRKKMNMHKIGLDRELLAQAKSGKIFFTRHTHPIQMSAASRRIEAALMEKYGLTPLA
jgi:hypothetical protein